MSQTEISCENFKTRKILQRDSINCRLYANCNLKLNINRLKKYNKKSSGVRQIFRTFSKIKTN